MLTELVRKRPYSLILFDEIEKAHPDVLNLLLQILEDGTLRDAQGRSVDFRNTLLILTSNLGAQQLGSRTLGFGGEQAAVERGVMLDAAKKTLHPELLNRLDELVVFGKLTQEHYLTITRNLLEQLSERVAKIGYTLSCTDRAVEALSQAKERDLYGARSIRRRITEEVENQISKQILTGELKESAGILLDYRNNAFCIVTQVAAQA